MYTAFSLFLGLVLCFFWNVIAATAAYIKGGGWKPGSNENCFSDSYPIQEASHWRSGSSLAIMEIVCNILLELKINHYSSKSITQLSGYQKDAYASVYGDWKSKPLTGNRDYLTLKVLLIAFIGAYQDYLIDGMRFCVHNCLAVVKIFEI